MCIEDLESGQNLRQGDAAILLPFLHHVLALDEDYKVVCLALVNGFGLRSISARHLAASTEAMNSLEIDMRCFVLRVS